ncbi:hypothetical protein GIB67_040362 [Kingdonia uniflora]|uniref:Amine oxidase n=1 Tax=Kingdonia uniflora TaxID=39325 RepID=A0A7J7L997_9MAGN|nr:hypothetical protein GIB67_040362 [Kingdonia uniflora]
MPYERQTCINFWFLLDMNFCELPIGAVCVADIQFKGRGRSENVWESPIDCLLFSFTLQMEDGHNVPLLQYVVSLVVTEAIKDGLPYLDIRIKWPSDLYLNGLKVGSICIGQRSSMSDPCQLYYRVKIAVDYEYMKMDSKTGMGCCSEASAVKNISFHSFLSENQSVHFLGMREIKVSVKTFKYEVAAPINMNMYEITLTIAADYDNMEMYFQTGIDELSYFQLLFKVFIHFLNIRAITVSVEIIESGISAPLKMIMYEITMKIVADYDHIAITVSVETIESGFCNVPEFQGSVLFPSGGFGGFEAEVVVFWYWVLVVAWWLCDVMCGGVVRDSMRFIEVVLSEPEKHVVALADAYFFPPFQPSLLPRTKGVTGFPGKLPPRGKVISSQVVPDVQPPMAMKKKGIEDLDLVMVDPCCAGYHSDADNPSHRLAKPLIFCRTESDCPMENGYARPVEGIYVLIDIQNMVVLEFEDRKFVPLPPADPLRNYTPGETRGGVDRSDVKPLQIIQPEGPSFRVNGNFVEWQKVLFLSFVCLKLLSISSKLVDDELVPNFNTKIVVVEQWNFRVGFTPREGMVIYSVTYVDGSRGRRPVAHRLSFFEMVVPYGDPNDPHYRKNAFDAGEDGLGFVPRAEDQEANASCKESEGERIVSICAIEEFEEISGTSVPAQPSESEDVSDKEVSGTSVPAQSSESEDVH